MGSHYRASYLLEYVACRLIQGIFWILPFKFAMRGGRLLGRLAGKVLHSRTVLAERNFQRVFQKLSPSEVKRSVVNVWENIGQTLVEFIKIPMLPHSQYQQYIQTEGLENVNKVLSKGRGFILLAAHMGNWELGGAQFSYLGYPISVVARVVKNPLVDKLVNNVRKKFKTHIISHRQALKKTLKALSQNRGIAVLIDHNLYQGGIFVDFFGRPASTSTMPALISRRKNVPVIPVHTYREKGKLYLVFEPPMTLQKTESLEDDIYENTKRMTRHVEGWIRRHPDQWLWIHNRWKRQPEQNKNESPKYSTGMTI